MDNKHNLNGDSLLTSYQVGSLLQVNPSSVNKWIKDGRIAAFRTPGGHRRIRAGDLVGFLTEHAIPMPPELLVLAKRRLLIVDEDERQLFATAKSLEAYTEQLELALAQDKIMAMVKVGAFKPHLVLIDAGGPHQSGLEICRKLHESSETEKIHIMVTSEEMTEALQAKALQAGAQQCLRKPIDAGMVLQALKNLR